MQRDKREYFYKHAHVTAEQERQNEALVQAKEKPKMEKPNCYECAYRGEVPGSAHSSCRHPAYGEAHGDSFRNLMAILGSVGRVPPVMVEGKGITVKGSAHGIRNGWFQHPYNFDPVWLEECTGFKKKEK